MKKSKGFSLIEMMIVIAIVAVLVGVIVPTVTGSTDKAAAATNAANLRGVEGEIVSMMLLEPDAFGDNSQRQKEIDFEQGWREYGDDELKEAKANVLARQSELKAKEDELADYKESDEYLEALAAKKDIEDTIDPEIESKQNEVAKYEQNMNHTGCVVRNSYGSLIIYSSHDEYCYQNNTPKVVALNVEIVALQAERSVKTLLLEPLTTVIVYETAVESAKTGLTAAETILASLESANQGKLDDLAAEEQALYEFTAVDGVITLDNGTTIQAPVSKKVNKDTVSIDKDVEMVVYVNPTTYQAYAYYKGGETMYNSAAFAAVAGDEE